MATRAKARAPTIGSLIDKLHLKRVEITELKEREKALVREREDLEGQVFQAMENQDTTSGAGKMASATVSDQHRPEVTDWDKLYQYIHENKFYHLLHRRVSTPGCLELLQQGEIPGVVKFTKKQINLRSL